MDWDRLERKQEVVLVERQSISEVHLSSAHAENTIDLNCQGKNKSRSAVMRNAINHGDGYEPLIRFDVCDFYDRFNRNRPIRRSGPSCTTGIAGVRLATQVNQARSRDYSGSPSLGMRQSPRGERLTEPTLGPSGTQLRLNWLR